MKPTQHFTADDLAAIHEAVTARLRQVRQHGKRAQLLALAQTVEDYLREAIPAPLPGLRP